MPPSRLWLLPIEALANPMPDREWFEAKAAEAERLAAGIRHPELRQDMLAVAAAYRRAAARLASEKSDEPEKPDKAAS
jgi:hypothetical protein